jgi:hypothetical protein
MRCMRSTNGGASLEGLAWAARQSAATGFVLWFEFAGEDFLLHAEPRRRGSVVRHTFSATPYVLPPVIASPRSKFLVVKGSGYFDC